MFLNILIYFAKKYYWVWHIFFIFHEKWQQIWLLKLFCCGGVDKKGMKVSSFKKMRIFVNNNEIGVNLILFALYCSAIILFQRKMQVNYKPNSYQKTTQMLRNQNYVRMTAKEHCTYIETSAKCLWLFLYNTVSKPFDFYLVITFTSRHFNRHFNSDNISIGINKLPFLLCFS